MSKIELALSIVIPVMESALNWPFTSGHNHMVAHIFRHITRREEGECKYNTNLCRNALKLLWSVELTSLPVAVICLYPILSKVHSLRLSRHYKSDLSQSQITPQRKMWTWLELGNFDFLFGYNLEAVHEYECDLFRIRTYPDLPQIYKNTLSKHVSIFADCSKHDNFQTHESI